MFPAAYPVRTTFLLFEQLLERRDERTPYRFKLATSPPRFCGNGDVLKIDLNPLLGKDTFDGVEDGLV